DARDRLPPLVSAEDRMKQVPELVEEGHHVTVLHEPRISLLPTGEVAHERRLGNLDALDAVSNAEVRGMVVLSGPRMEVQIEAADHGSLFPHLVGFDARVPDVRVRDPLVRD